MSRTTLGIDWGDIGKNAFSGLHLAGKTAAKAFGFGGVADQLERVESNAGLLKDWSKSQSAASTTVLEPDYVVLQHASGQADVLQPLSVVVSGGKRTDGNGYKTGDGVSKKFSFGYDAPQRLDVTLKAGKISYTDVTKVLFLGGVEAKTNVQGDPMNANLARQILGELGLTEDNSDYTIGASYVRGAAVYSKTSSIARTRQPTRAGFVVKTTPRGRQYTALHIGPAKGHVDSIANARDAGKRAVSVGNRLLALTKKVHVVGAHPKVHYTVAQLQKVAKQSVTAGKNLLKNADVHEKLVKNQAQRKQAGAAAVQAMTAPKGGHAVHGDAIQHALGDNGFWTEIVGSHWTEVSGAHRDVVGDEDDEVLDRDQVIGSYIVVGDPAPIPDPLHPGYMTDQSVDPNYGGTAPSDGSAPTTDGSVDPSMDASQNYGLGPPPSSPPPISAANGDFAGDPNLDQPLLDQTEYDSTASPLPAGAVILTDPGRLGHNSVGSKASFDGSAPAGEGGGGTVPDSDGLWHGGYRYHNDGWWFNWQGDNQRFYSKKIASYTDNPSNLRDLSETSIAHHWGPLVGNPGLNPQYGTEFKGLRYDRGANQWFWYRDAAPAWATTGDDQARLAKAILDYKTAYTAAAANAAVQAASDKLDAQNAAKVAKQVAAEDADMAHKQSINQTQLDTQQATLDQQNNQSMAQLDIASQQGELEAAKQETQMQMQERQFMLQHPELMAPAPQDDGGDDDDGGGQAGDGSDGIDWGDSSARGQEDRSNEPVEED